MRAKESMEVSFWYALGFIVVMSVLIPIGIGLGTRLWTWALS